MSKPILLAVCLLPVCLLAQKPVAIGDTVPDILFETVLNHSGTKARLSDFKEDLILLDFWASWCASCAHAFPKIDSLQSTFVGDLKVILVNSRSTGDDLSKVQAFLIKWKSRTGRSIGLTIAAVDTLADNLFPHQIIPHYAWIYKGRLVALTSSHEVTDRRIRNILEHNSIQLSVKKDLDANRPLFSDPSLPVDNLLNYSILVKGWYNGLPAGSRQRTKGGVVCGRAFTNRPLSELYKTAAMKIDPRLAERLVVINSRDSSVLVPPTDGERSEAWYIDHAYNIDVIVPVEQASQLYTRMLDALNTYSGYNGFFEDRTIPCWVLRMNGPSTILKSKGGAAVNNLGGSTPSLKNGTMDMLVKYLNGIAVTRDYVVDETGYGGKIDIAFTDVTDIHRLCQALKEYGLELRREERKMRVFVIRKQ
jgi:thiol-disulfide isomerase/thioredoxin